MKQLKVVVSAVMAGGILLAFSLSDGEAQARGGGQGQRLRDGACFGRAVTQGNVSGQATVQQRGYGRLTGACTGLGLGNGARLRPQDGTGYRHDAR